MKHLCAACIALGLCIVLALAPPGHARAAEAGPVYGPELQGFDYPSPVSRFRFTSQGATLDMAFLDVKPVQPNGRTVVLLHGRNFPSSYWEPTISALAAAGYRVVAPDQIGFGKSSKPGFAYSFDDMARTTIALLDMLGVDHFDLVGHSMGGMLAVRIARAFGARIDHLVLYSPIGLEDYRFYVPPVTDERLVEQERSLSADGYRKQLMTNYALSLPANAIEPFVELREAIRSSGEYPRWLKSFVASYQMIYTEPVVHEIPLIDRPTLFIMGGNDHNAPGRAYAPPELRPRMGQNAALARALAAQMRDARVVVFDGVGHLAHLEAEGPFNQALLGFLAK